MDHNASDRPAEPSRLLRATSMMLDDLAELRRREHALDRQLRGTRLRIDSLMVPLSAALGALPRGEREAPRARFANIEAEHGAKPRRLGLTPASEAVLDCLAAHPGDTVTAAELQAALARAGVAPRPRYAALTLNRLKALGLVTRTGFGTYAIHRFHPELVARRLAAAREAEPARSDDA